MDALQNRYKLLIPKPPSSLTSLVSELIDHDFGCWNSQLFGQLFLPFELAQILYIPLPTHSHLDQFSWGPNMRDVFSVKSAYHFIKDCEERSQPQAFGLSGEDAMVWKKLWHLKTIPRHIHMAWRILHQALLIRSKLLKRGVPCVPLYPMWRYLS